MRTVSDKGFDDIVYNTRDSRNFDVEYVNGHIHNVVAFGYQTFSVTATSTHARSVRRGGELAGILQACRPDSTLGVHQHGRLTSGSQSERQRGRTGKIASEEALLCHRYMVATLFWDVRVSTGPLLSASYSRIDDLYYEGLAWVRYDMSFRRQAPASGNRNWSEVNSTLYSVCFTGKSQRNLQCELCLVKSHTTNNCPLQGECTDRQLGMPFQKVTATGSGDGDNYPHQERCASCGTTISVGIQDAGIRMYVCIVEEITQWWFAT